MWQHHYLRRIDLHTVPVILGLMIMSVLIIASTTCELQCAADGGGILTSYCKKQIQWFGVGVGSYLFFARLDYRKLRNWAWILYTGTILLLLGLFFAEPIQNVHRWYRIPIIGGTLQPSEYTKLSIIVILSCFLERRGRAVGSWSTFLQALGLILIPFLLILKQPDLGSALVLFPMVLGMFYFGGIHPIATKVMSAIGITILIFISLVFTGMLSHNELKSVATHLLKEYQYERFNPETYHRNAAQTSIAIGAYRGSGWKKSIFTGKQFLPAAHTDSVFPAFTEEFGLFGATFMLLLFFTLIYRSFQVTVVARDRFGEILSAGIATYLAIHVIINIGMMCGLLPITGVPLILITYGGSSITLTMSALGILQSIYIRRFMF